MLKVKCFFAKIWQIRIFFIDKKLPSIFDLGKFFHSPIRDCQGRFFSAVG